MFLFARYQTNVPGCAAPIELRTFLAGRLEVARTMSAPIMSQATLMMRRLRPCGGGSKKAMAAVNEKSCAPLAA
jgi:hypothetical protein